VAVSVMVWVPTERVEIDTDVSVPILPSISDVQTRLAPVNVPSSASVPVPVNVTESP